MKKIDPNKSFVNLTYKCNNNCISCIMENHYQNNLNIKTIKKKIKEILGYSKHIEFNGGEPTIRKDIFKILAYTGSLNPNIEIGLISNVRLFSYQKNVVSLAKLRLRNFKVMTTIYGHNPKLHNAVTRTPNSFEQQIKGIKNLINAGINVELRVVVNKINYKYLDNISDYLINNFSSKNFIYVNFVNTKLTGQALKNKKRVAVKVEEVIPYLEKGAKKLVNFGFNITLSHFPHCVLPKELWKYSVGPSAEKTEIIFLENCKNCFKRNECSGFWKSYANLFGVKKVNLISEQELVFSELANLPAEKNISGETLLETAKSLFDEMNLSKIWIKEAFLSFYPVVLNEKGFCGTCLCENGWNELENFKIKDFYVDSNLTIIKDKLKIGFKKNSKLFSLYTSALNSIVQINPKILKKYYGSFSESLNKKGENISKIGFALHCYIDYKKAGRINVFDRGIYEHKERKEEAEKESLKLRKIFGKEFDKKVCFYKEIKPEILDKTDVLIISGSSISNGSFDSIINKAKNVREIIIFGRSSLLYPKILFKKGVNSIFGSIPPKNLIDLALKNYKKYISLEEPGEKVFLRK